MGNSHSSRSINKDGNSSNGTSNSSSNSKEKSGAKLKFASPENRVLPVVTNGPQRLRCTDNGNILHSGGTISGRRNNHSSESSNDSEFTRYLQRKSQIYKSPPQNESFHTLLGHRKSHSDPDIVRKMMEENETEEDEDGKYETESNPTQRSIIAVSPSKAKIKSRKKKKAPEPPQSNTLPRTQVVGRNNLKCENQDVYDPGYDANEVPRRPLPPIPLEEMPPAPPPPPPDYNRAIEDRDLLKSGKSFQKNRRIVDKWKLSKPNFDYFVERRQRSKSLDRADDPRLSEREQKNERFDRNHSLRNLTEREQKKAEESAKPPIKSALNDAIIDAARKRAERLARTRMCRNLSFKSSLNQSAELMANDTGQVLNSKKDSYAKDRDPHTNGNDQSPIKPHQISYECTELETKIQANGVPSRNASHQKNTNGFKNPKEKEISEVNTKLLHDQQANALREKYLREQRTLSVSDNSAGNVKEYRNSKESRESYFRNSYEQDHAQLFLQEHNTINKEKEGCIFKDFRSPYKNNDSPIDNLNRNKNNNPTQYNSHHRYSYENKNREHQENRGFYTKQVFEDFPQGNPENDLSTKKPNYSYHKSENETKENDSNNYPSRNFSRTGAIHKRPQDGRRRLSYAHGTDSDENIVKKTSNETGRLEIGILPLLPNDKQTKRNKRSQEAVLGLQPHHRHSSSSVSEEEMEINLQLKPTLPRRQIDISSFSPTEVWKSIHTDYIKSHQQRSDVSSEDGEDIMEEKIHRINRPVAPRRLIQDRSGDSGISPDVESPMFLNENFESPKIATVPMHSTPNILSNGERNAAWVPQLDLEDSEYGSEASVPENKANAPNEIVQPKLAMPNFMFTSRSLPRTDLKNGTEERDVLEKEKVRSRDRRKRNSKTQEAQHFNSLRNLKRALGLKSKAAVVDMNGLDSNWSLSRSLPNFEDVDTTDDLKHENEVPEVSVLDHIRRSNSESRMILQENRFYSVYSSQNVNNEQRRSFPRHPTEGHVMYLPEYCSTLVPCQVNTQRETSKFNNNNSADDNSKEFDIKKTSSNSEAKKLKNKKKFSYQSTVRQQQKKKLEEKLAKDIEEKEKMRDTEIEWMNIVEDEFRKQRVREKTDVRQRLRIFALEEKTASRCMQFGSSQYCTNGINSSNGIEGMEENLHCSIENLVSNVDEETGLSSNLIQNDVQNMCNIETTSHFPFSTVFPGDSDVILYAVQVYDQCNAQVNDSSQKRNHYIQKSFIVESDKRNVEGLLNSNQRESLPTTQAPNVPQTASAGHGIPKTLFSETMQHRSRNLLHEKEIPIVQTRERKDASFREELNGNLGSVYPAEVSGRVNGALPNNAQNDERQHYIESGAHNVQNGVRDDIREIEGSYVDKNGMINSYVLQNDTHSVSAAKSAIKQNKEQRYIKTEFENHSRSQQDYSSSFEDKECDATRGRLNHNDRQPPTGMKKWLRRQNRDHNCHENIPRPEPEGARSSSDDCKQVDGRKERTNGWSRQNGANLSSNSK